MPKHLSPEFLHALRSAPLSDDQPNKVNVALGMTTTTLREVQAETGINFTILSCIANGTRPATLENARKLAAFWGCEVDDLFPRKAAA